MRYLSKIIEKDWQLQKMIFIGGPRQVGKTTYALSLLHQDANESTPGYYNWDNLIHRQRILNYEINSVSDVILFDEIHKYPDWRNFLKGFFDTNKKIDESFFFFHCLFSPLSFLTCVAT